MTLSSQQTRRWKGQAAVQPGTGVFKGRSGDNTEHRHWADQISIALEGELVVSREDNVYRGKAFFIASNTPHKLKEGLVLSIYLDPFLRFYHQTGAPVKGAEVILDVSELAPRITTLFDSPNSLQQGLAQFCSEFSFCRQEPASDKLNSILAALQRGVYGGAAMNRAELARLAGLSETRFSHWFKEKTGMPLRSYRKWLRLVHGVEKVLSGNSLIDAAHAADFSDQAYFSRTFKNAFGVTPAVAFSSVFTESKL